MKKKVPANLKEIMKLKKGFIQQYGQKQLEEDYKTMMEVIDYKRSVGLDK